MSVQQQLLLNKRPFPQIDNCLVTIEQIYQVDTITLQELIEEFQQQPFFKHLNQIQKLRQIQVNNRISQKFVNLSTRQLKKWYHLAKIQLKQRQKIQQFALKLISEDIEQNNFNINLGSSNIQIPSKKLIKVDNQKQKHPVNSLLDSQFNKTTNVLTNVERTKTQIELNKKQISIPNIQKHQIFNPTQMKTLQVKCNTKQSLKDQKVLSKKQFLQMMKFKLNQGSDYKTGSFIKEPIRKLQNQSKKKLPLQIQKKSSHQSNETFASKIKSKSVYFPPKAQIISQNKGTVKQNQSKKVKESQKSMGRYKNYSSYTSRQQTTKNISISNSFHDKYAKKINKAQTSRTAPVSRAGQRNDKESKIIEQKKMQVNEEKSLIKIQKPQESQGIQIKTVVQQSLLQKSPEPIAVNNFESQIKKQFSKGFLLEEQQQKIVNQTIFVENEDAYDDEPQILQNEIALKKEEIIYQQNENYQQQKIQSHQQQILQDMPSQTQENQNKIIQPKDEKDFLMQEQQETLIEEIQVGSKIIQVIDNSQHCQIESLLQKESSSNTLLQKCNKFEAQALSQIHKVDNQPFRLTQKINSKIISINTHPQKLIVPKPQYPPYHLHFPTFYHLFHSTKSQNASANNNKFSMPHLLKALQLSLQSYFQKQVLKIAKNHLQNKITLYDHQNLQQTGQNQQNIELKCITQIQFINSTQGSSIFDIDLTSFKQKSMSLLQKLQNNALIQFQLQKQTKKQQINHLKQKQNHNNSLFYRVVKNKPQVYDIINTSFYRTQNWLQLPHGMQLHGCWNLLWTWSKPQIDFNTLIKFQKVNHFPGSKQLARKDLLKKNIEKIKKLSKKLHDYFDIIPDTYFLPGQNMAFIKKFRESEGKGRNLWILKPVGLSRGRGISLVSKLQDVVFSEPIVMQKYIHNPFLLEGYKFDLRIYVLVTSINPLQCFIYKQGFARVSTEKYCNDLQEIDNKYVHLTNYSIQKDSIKSPGIFSQKQKQLGGCKLTLKMLRQKLNKKSIKWQGIWSEIKQVILKSLISCMKYIPHNSNCFELFGYDIMLDSDLKCWLIEVNSSPSLQQDFLIDQIIKQQLIDDTIQIVDPINFNREQLLKVIKRRRRQVEGMKSHVNYANNSVQQLDQDLFKILNGKILRNYGEIKENVNFECIAPGNEYQKILKTVQHYTHDPFVKRNNFNC